jgi:hypothetical protein
MSLNFISVIFFGGGAGYTNIKALVRYKVKKYFWEFFFLEQGIIVILETALVSYFQRGNL